MARLSHPLVFAAMVLSASAHTIFQVCFRAPVYVLVLIVISSKEVYVNGVDQGHLTGIRVPDYDGVSIRTRMERISTSHKPFHSP